jgi:transglutaminase-like putative cysteine protease
VGEVIAATALAAGVPLTAGGPPQAELRVRLPAARNELDWAGLWSRSERRGDTLVLRATADSALRARYQLSEPPDSSLASWLASEPLIQSENPRIRAQARLLAGRERDPARVARRLSEWVQAEVRKQSAGGQAVPNAVNVFETRRGDCNEHTVLYVALARAAGIPARAVAGLLYRDGRFYYHAWPEVYLGDWAAVDPMLGQFPADATHLPLVTGGLARPLELLRLVGKLTLEVL